MHLQIPRALITLWSRGLEKLHCFCTSRIMSVKCFGHFKIRYNKQQGINISHPILKPGNSNGRCCKNLESDMISRFLSLDLYPPDFSLIFSCPLQRQGLASKKFEICFYIFLPDYAALIYIFQIFLFWKFRKNPRKRTTLL